MGLSFRHRRVTVRRRSESCPTGQTPCPCRHLHAKSDDYPAARRGKQYVTVADYANTAVANLESDFVRRKLGEGMAQGGYAAVNVSFDDYIKLWNLVRITLAEHFLE